MRFAFKEINPDIEVCENRLAMLRNRVRGKETTIGVITNSIAELNKEIEVISTKLNEMHEVS